MVWQEGLVGCSPHRLGSPSLSPFRLVVGTGPGYLFKSQGSLGVAVLYHPIPPFLRQEAAVCGWPSAGGTTGKCKVECRLLLCTCRVARPSSLGPFVCDEPEKAAPRCVWEEPSTAVAPSSLSDREVISSWEALLLFDCEGLSFLPCQ